MAITIDRAFPIGADPPDETVQVAGDTDWRELAPYLGCINGVGTYGLNVGNEFEVFGDSTSMTVKVKSGECFIQGTYGRNADQETLALAGSAPPASNSRVSIVVLRLDIPNKRIQIHELQGSNSTGTPTPPGLTQSATIWDIPLAYVTIPAGGVVTAGSVVDYRTFCRPRGHVVGQYLQYPESAAPDGFLPCDGAAVSRITYHELYNVISTVYGSGNGSTTFNVPDKRGEVLVTRDDLGSGDAGRLDGSTTLLTGHYGSQNQTPGSSSGTAASGVDTTVVQFVNSGSVMQPSGIVYTWISARPR